MIPSSDDSQELDDNADQEVGRWFIFRSLPLVFDGKECNMMSIREVTMF